MQQRAAHVASEVAVRADLKDRVHEGGPVDRQSGRQPVAPRFQVEIRGGETEEDGGSLVVLVERIRGEWPVAEILRLQRPAPSAPPVAATTEHPKSTGVQGIGGSTD